MRIRWPKNFPWMVVHTRWRQADDLSLKTHSQYTAAKLGGDARAAFALVKDLVADEALDRIVDIMRDAEPMVLYPSLAYERRNNMIPLAFSEFLAHDLGLDVCETVRQTHAVRRSNKNGWARLGATCQPDFEGEIEAGRSYILVDDVFTLGGTLSSLRGFVEANGGQVIGMSCLAHTLGNDCPIALSEGTGYALRRFVGNDFECEWRQELGYGIDCLTEPEARYLLGAPSVERIRKAVFGRAGSEGAERNTRPLAG